MKRSYLAFVSYRSSDRPWVKRHLLPLLARAARRDRRCPHPCFFDVLENRFGVPTSVLLRTGQQRAIWTVAVLTPTYGASPFTDFELRQASWNQSLVPVLARACRPPAGVDNAACIDFSTRARRRRNAVELLRRLAQSPPHRSRLARHTIDLQALAGEVQSAWRAFRRALRRGDPLQAFRTLRDQLFEPLHYRFGSYVDGAHLLQMLLPALRASVAGRRPITGPTMRPVTGTPLRFPAPDESECPIAWTQLALGVTYRALWQSSRAAHCFRRALRIYEQYGNTGGTAVTHIDLADVAWERGDVAAACGHLNAAERAAKRIGARFLQAVAHQDLGLRLAYACRWRASARHFAAALRFAGGDSHRRSIVFAHRARAQLLRIRWLRAQQSRDEGAVRRALRAAASCVARLRAAGVHRRNDRHGVRALWLIGAVRLASGERGHRALLRAALARCRALALAEFEADVLLDLVRTEQRSRRFGVATALAREALGVAQRSGRVLQIVDTSLALGSVLRDAGDARGSQREAERAARLLRGRVGRPVLHRVAKCEAAQAWPKTARPTARVKLPVP